ncbi:MAG: response regulator transcription factor [Spirochaetales bacterium]|jgi:two-component system, OmpR family, response regulator|nr:response regulator transcription factor [Spirochaetales bacterium]
MRVLIIEDDPQISSYVANGLKQAGFAVDTSASGNEGYELARQGNYDALIIDIMLPGMDGISLLKALRGEGINTPVLILSAKSSLDDKIQGFQSGGDDYITKPFSFSELLVRLQALLRRASRAQGSNDIQVGELKMDLTGRQVTRGDTEIELQPREFALLEYLMRNAGNVVSKTMILEHVWDYHFDPQTNVVDVLVHRLRSKLDKKFSAKMLQTVRGIGYVLKVP